MTTVSAGVARVFGLLASLITVPLTYSYLGPERYGLWMVLISIIAAMGFADLGIGNGLMNAVSEAYGKDDRALVREYVTSAFVMMLAIAAFLAAIGAAGYPFVPWMRLFNVTSEAVAAEGSKAFLVLFSWFVLSIPLGVITRAQAGLQQGYFPQIVGAFGSIVSLCSLLFVIALHGTLALLVLASTFGAAAAVALNGWLLFREHRWLVPSWRAYRGDSASKILKLGLLFFVLQCAFALSYTSDNIVIAQILGAAAVAAYAVPQKLFSVVSLGIGMATGPLWPAYGEAIARGDVAWVRRAFRGSLWLDPGACRALDSQGLLRPIVACPHVAAGCSGCVGCRFRGFSGNILPPQRRGSPQGAGHHSGVCQPDQYFPFDLSHTPAGSDGSLPGFNHYAASHHLAGMFCPDKTLVQKPGKSKDRNRLRRIDFPRATGP